jgi:hypothetical protein
MRFKKQTPEKCHWVTEWNQRQPLLLPGDFAKDLQQKLTAIIISIRSKLCCDSRGAAAGSCILRQHRYGAALSIEETCSDYV